jgi:periplasmic protein TonB
MTARSNSLLLAAIAVSVGAHFLLLLLVPWKPVQPRAAPREIVPVRLIHVAPPVPSPLPLERVVRKPLPERETVTTEPVVQPTPQEVRPEPEPATEVSVVQEEAALIETPPGPVAPPASPAEAREALPAAPRQPSAEVAAYHAILSELRERALAGIRYPAIARANGWKGTVVVALRLDGAGKLQQALVRQSSGYEVLDRAATALVRKITPVPNPLELPVSIEVPITYALD